VLFLIRPKILIYIYNLNVVSALQSVFYLAKNADIYDLSAFGNSLQNQCFIQPKMSTPMI